MKHAHKKPPKILFICKKNETYGFISYTRRSSGLYNSTRFIVEGLRGRNVDAHIVEVIDNNYIDREVTRLRPDIVVIEALWVVPGKFEILKKLHPHVKWFVHLHSDMPFLALEGIATEWILSYAINDIGLIANSQKSYDSLRCILNSDELIFLPNVYLGKPHKKKNTSKTHLDIGCFGAVRPLKSHLIQALAAIEFAREKCMPLRFYINASRVETGGSPVLKNLIKLFDRTPNAELVQVHWCEPEEFLHLLKTKIDIGMQVSLTETFNVVTADYVTAGLPVVVSKEVTWVNWLSKVKDETCVDDILNTMRLAYDFPILIRFNQWRLERNSKRAQEMWLDFVKSETHSSRC